MPFKIYCSVIIVNLEFLINFAVGDSRDHYLVLSCIASLHSSMYLNLHACGEVGLGNCPSMWVSPHAPVYCGKPTWGTAQPSITTQKVKLLDFCVIFGQWQLCCLTSVIETVHVSYCPSHSLFAYKNWWPLDLRMSVGSAQNMTTFVTFCPPLPMFSPVLCGYDINAFQKWCLYAMIAKKLLMELLRCVKNIINWCTLQCALSVHIHMDQFSVY